MKLMILDRDGVINYDRDDYVKTPDEWIPIPGSLEGIAKLCHQGIRVVVVTNQSGIARRIIDLTMLHRIHAKMHRMISEAGGSIDAIFFCPAFDDTHPDRKPNPGMLKDVMERFRVDAQDVPVIGDTERDIHAAIAIGARPQLVRTGKGECTLARSLNLPNVPVFDDLAHAVDHLLRVKPSNTATPP
ncbi:MAG: D-glycero-beta-D-manno-heptose 1,7-bisphosphate 7-phosphatase [Gammaproteobacteria bacterium]